MSETRPTRKEVEQLHKLLVAFIESEDYSSNFILMRKVCDAYLELEAEVKEKDTNIEALASILRDEGHTVEMDASGTVWIDCHADDKENPGLDKP